MAVSGGAAPAMVITPNASRRTVKIVFQTQLKASCMKPDLAIKAINGTWTGAEKAAWEAHLAKTGGVTLANGAVAVMSKDGVEMRKLLKRNAWREEGDEMWYWGRPLDEEWVGPFGSKKKAIEDAERVLEPGAAYAVGKMIPWVPAIDAERVVQGLSEMAMEYDNTGYLDELEWAEIEELGSVLSAALCEWLADKGLMPAFGEYEDVVELTIPEA